MDSVWTTVLQILAAPATLVFGALATLAVQLIKIQSDKIIASKLKLAGDTLDIMNQICRNAVQAAEQEKKAGHITDKKAYAIVFAQRIRDENKINFNDVMLDALIDSLVWDTFSGTTTTTTTDPSTGTSTSSSVNTSTSTSTNPEPNLNPNPNPNSGALG